MDGTLQDGVGAIVHAFSPHGSRGPASREEARGLYVPAKDVAKTNFGNCTSVPFQSTTAIILH